MLNAYGYCVCAFVNRHEALNVSATLTSLLDGVEIKDGRWMGAHMHVAWVLSVLGRVLTGKGLT